MLLFKYYGSLPGMTALATATMLMTISWAQTPLEPASKTSGTVGQSTQILRHQSIFDSYKKFDEPEKTSWQQANDTVGKIGGWRVYAKEAAQADEPTHSASKSTERPVHQQGQHGQQEDKK